MLGAVMADHSFSSGLGKCKETRGTITSPRPVASRSRKTWCCQQGSDSPCGSAHPGPWSTQHRLTSTPSFVILGGLLVTSLEETKIF